jgi:ABC-2 type transport system ATP-binding protein
MDALPLACRAVTKRFGPIVALDDVDLSVPAGSITGFLGPNGAGKSTLLRIVTGVLRANAGIAEVFGIDARTPAARARLGSMPADPVFYPALSGRANLDLFAALQRTSPTDRAWACELLDLTDDVLDRAAKTYSSGMRQKLGIVQAVQTAPDLVILDEPANRLDPLAHRAFEELVGTIAASGRAVLLSSHTLSEVEDLCDRIVMINRGRVLLAAAADELVSHARRTITVRFTGAPPILPAEIEVLETDTTVLRGRLPAARPDLLRATLAAANVTDVLVEPARLEDVFLDLYREPGVGDA